jgi:hypothetical protein
MGAVTEFRSRIENLTDEPAYAPWTTLFDDEADEVGRIAKAVRETALAAGLFRGKAFGPRDGEQR